MTHNAITAYNTGDYPLTSGGYYLNHYCQSYPCPICNPPVYYPVPYYVPTPLYAFPTAPSLIVDILKDEVKKLKNEIKKLRKELKGIKTGG